MQVSQNSIYEKQLPDYWQLFFVAIKYRMVRGQEYMVKTSVAASCVIAIISVIIILIIHIWMVSYE